MMAFKPVVFVSLPQPHLAEPRIRAVAPDADVRIGPYDPYADSYRGDPAMLRDVNVMVCEFPPANLEDCPDLKWIQVTSAGYAQLVGLGLTERGIAATNGLGNFDIPIAEWNVMMMLVWQRRLPEMMANQRQAKWDPAPRFQAEARPSTIGFYGYGGIARETTRIAKAMGMTVWVMTRDGKAKPRHGSYTVPGTGDPDGKLPDRVFPVSDKQSFFAGLDYLFITMPLTPASKGLVGEAELRMLKPTAVLINPARAAIVEEQAFIRCMREGWIRAASFDVHYQYPLPPEHPLWHMPNVLLTPHISGSVYSTFFVERLYDIFNTNLKRFLAGQPMLNALSAEQLSGA